MKIKNRKRGWTIVALMLIGVGGVLLFFELLGDLGMVQTSLVKYYRGSSLQCVEYVQSYYRNMFGIEINQVGRAQDLFKKAGSYGLYAHNNGENIPPQPGDILVFGHANRVGHVAIITGVINEGVLIVERNWGTTRITTNGNKPLPMTVEGGNYIVADRDDYRVLGWVSRTLEKPDLDFQFSEKYFSGWLSENHATPVFNEDDFDYWTNRIVGKSPRLVSPVVFEGKNFSAEEKIALRARVRNSSKQGKGKMLLRDTDGVWSVEMEFEFSADGEFHEIELELSKLDQDFKCTQLMLILNDQPTVGKELWDLEWLKINNQ